MNDPKILTLDIETSPHLGYFFSTKPQFISPSQIITPTRVISFAAKWHHRTVVKFWSEYEGFNRWGGATQEGCHLGMVKAAYDLLDEADVVVTYNGDNFDLRHLRREFRKYDLGQPSPFASVDLWKVVKKDEEWASHKLSYITEQYHLTGKMENSGFSLWRGVLSDDPELRRRSWLEMRRYNKQDVRTTEELFDAAADLIQNIPHADLYSDEPAEEQTCKTCRGSLQRRGHAYTKTRRYARYYCNACRKWSRGTRSDRSVGTT